MCFGNSGWGGNNCLWIIPILILVCCYCGNGGTVGGGCSGGCGCNDGCGDNCC